MTVGAAAPWRRSGLPTSRPPRVSWRDNESEKKMSELKIKTLEETLSRASAQINTLQTQVDEAKKQVQDIAVKAIEGASGAKALSHINQIAMEQAKTRSNSL